MEETDKIWRNDCTHCIFMNRHTLLALLVKKGTDSLYHVQESKEEVYKTGPTAASLPTNSIFTWLCVCIYVCVRARACVRACMHACMRACVCTVMCMCGMWVCGLSEKPASHIYLFIAVNKR